MIEVCIRPSLLTSTLGHPECPNRLWIALDCAEKRPIIRISLCGVNPHQSRVAKGKACLTAVRRSGLGPAAGGVMAPTPRNMKQQGLPSKCQMPRSTTAARVPLPLGFTSPSFEAGKAIAFPGHSARICRPCALSLPLPISPMFTTLHPIHIVARHSAFRCKI